MAIVDTIRAHTYSQAKNVLVQQIISNLQYIIFNIYIEHMDQASVMCPWFWSASVALVGYKCSILALVGLAWY